MIVSSRSLSNRKRPSVLIRGAVSPQTALKVSQDTNCRGSQELFFKLKNLKLTKRDLRRMFFVECE